MIASFVTKSGRTKYISEALQRKFELRKNVIPLEKKDKNIIVQFSNITHFLVRKRKAGGMAKLSLSRTVSRSVISLQYFQIKRWVFGYTNRTTRRVGLGLPLANHKLQWAVWERMRLYRLNRAPFDHSLLCWRRHVTRLDSTELKDDFWWFFHRKTFTFSQSTLYPRRLSTW